MRPTRARLSLLLVALCRSAVLAAAAPAGSPAPYTPPSPSAEVAVLVASWHDPQRGRDVPVRIYYPSASRAACPVILFSHGLGGNRDTYEYLGRHWAGCGYVSVHLQHLGSDDAVWRGGAGLAGLAHSVADPRNAVARVQDVRFGIDRVLALNADGASPLFGRIDPGRIGMAGHSFGAWTTLAVVGARLPILGTTLADPRIRAAVAMSPMGLPAGSLDGITVPVFELTGTRDASPFGNSPPGERRLVFDDLRSPGTLLVTFKGADHFTFVALPFRRWLDAKFLPLIRDASTAFWDAHLRGNAAARAWLEDGPFAQRLGDAGVLEVKKP